MEIISHYSLIECPIDGVFPGSIQCTDCWGSAYPESNQMYAVYTRAEGPLSIRTRDGCLWNMTTTDNIKGPIQCSTCDDVLSFKLNKENNYWICIYVRDA